jgi:DNA-directed RNA polymerase subunit RPC12/RpoP
MTLKSFLLSRKEIKRLAHCHYVRNFGWKCYHCEKRLKVGEKVVSSGHIYTKYYCAKCAKEVLLI